MRLVCQATTRLVVFVLAVFLGAATAASAQVTSGTLVGTVKDKDGGVIPGATVTLISETKQTKSAPAVSSTAGDFVFPVVVPDVYTVQIELSSFKTVRRSGVQVSPGSRISVGTVILELGSLTEIVTVSSELSLVQTTSGERSFVVEKTQIESLPIASRTFQAFAALTPGVDGTTRAGGGGGNNFMMDGVVVMDPGNGGPALQVNTETIQEVKVLTSGYQAEYGRASGLQITAVTKSGTNRFTGSLYDVERNSNWNANSKTNILNGDPKSVSKQRDFGFSIGGPIGKPGGANKLFFFYAQEWNPRQIGGDVVRYRMPTALERVGDFSQTLDQNGALYPYIKDPRLSGACTAASRVACYADGGVLGRIPANQLYANGLAILNWWPLPNLTNAQAAGLSYNYESTRPVENALGYQPVLKVDYQPTTSLRLSAKYAAYGQRSQTFLGNLPGFTDTKPSHMVTPSYLATGSYAGRNFVFEATLGHSSEQQEGCAFTSSTGALGPAFCTTAIAQSPISNYKTAGFGSLPLLFPNAQVIDPSYHYVEVLNSLGAPFWEDGRLYRAPTFSWGNRVANAPPNTPFPGYFQAGGTWDFSASMTKTFGPHTVKAGYYYQHELHYRNGGTGSANGALSFQQDAVGTNPYDTSFGFANAAIGSFSSFAQISKFLEAQFVYSQNEFYVQDSWKVNGRLSVNFGARVVNQQPYYDARQQASNFFADKWSASSAPLLYVAACAGAPPCSGTNRQAMNPVTGQLLGANSSLAIGTLVTGTGSLTNGAIAYGQGIVDTGYKWPVLAIAPRFDFAYDYRGDSKIVIRGGTGLFYDRPSANAAGTYNFLGGPPFTTTATVRYSQLQTLGSSGLSTNAPSALNAHQYDAPLPASIQWNLGTQLVLPWSTTIDVSYVGQHAYDQIQSVNINAIDIGSAFAASTQDTTAAASTTPGAASIAATNPDLIRSFRGYGAITLRNYDGWRTYPSLQLSLTRRFQHGVSFGINDTIGLSDKGSLAPRLTHPAAGVYQARSDDPEYQALLGNNNPRKHLLKANFVWDLPDVPSGGSLLMRAVAAVVNDWQVSGIWTGSTGTAYTVGYTYTGGVANVNLTGSPDYGARVVLVGDPGNGCSSDQFRQFNTAAFAGPTSGSTGLESGNGYLRGCFQSVFDTSLQRNIKIGGNRSIQVRLDVFNVFNQAIVTARNTTMSLVNLSTNTTITNLPFDASGNLIDARSRPSNAGFGVATAYQDPRSVQLQIRFKF